MRWLCFHDQYKVFAAQLKVIRVADLQSRIARDLRQHSRLTHDARKHKPAGERSVMKLVAKEKSKLVKSISKALQELRIWLSASGELPPALAVMPQQCNDVGALLKTGVCPWQCVPSRWLHSPTPFSLSLEGAIRTASTSA